MRKAWTVLVVLTFSAAILSYYSGVINWKLVDVRGSPRTSVQLTSETSLINPNIHAPHDTLQTGSTEGHTSASSWQTPQESLKTASTATPSTGASTWPAGPTTLPDVTTKVPQDSTHTRAPEGTDTSAPAGSLTTPSPGGSSASITQRTTAPQTTTSVNPDTSAPGSLTTPSPGGSSSSLTQRTTAPQTTTSVNPDTSAPGSLTTPSPGGSSSSITQRTTAPQTTTSVNPDTSAAPGSSTTLSPGGSSSSITHRTMTPQTIAGPTTLRITTQTTPSTKQTSLTTSRTATSAKGKTTRALPTSVTHHVTATTSSTKTTVGPTLAPQPSAPQTGNYLVYNGSRACLRAEMGVQLLIEDKKTYFTSQMYFNLDPNGTQASGNCGPQRSNLLLTFPGGFVNLTFAKVKQSYHLETVEASLTVSSMNNYSGLKDGLTMFETKVGYSFKCVSEQSVKLSSSLQLHTSDVHLQAFDFDGEHFGNVDECFSDKNRREIPVAVGLSIAGLLGVLLTACLVARKRPGNGYERI